MLKGTDYLKNLETQHATVFEAIYGIATTVDNWPAAVLTLLSLYDGGHLYFNRQLHHERELIETNRTHLRPSNDYWRSDEDNETGVTYTYKVVTSIESADPSICLNKLTRVYRDHDICSGLEKFKVIDGTPICGIEIFDQYVLSSEEISRITDGLDGVILNTLFSEIKKETEEKIAERDTRIEHLESEIFRLEKASSEINPRAKSFVGRVIFLCAKQLIGENTSQTLHDRELTRLLVKKLSAGRDKEVASVEGLLDYIKVGRAQEGG
ncbi:hypothetical protein ABIC11_003837 [Pseudomonas oryzihabitans]